MVAPHKVRTGLQVPDFVREAWKSKDQNAMAKILMDANWDKDGCLSCCVSIMNCLDSEMFASPHVSNTLAALCCIGQVHQHRRSDHPEKILDHSLGGRGMVDRT